MPVLIIFLRNPNMIIDSKTHSPFNFFWGEQAAVHVYRLTVRCHHILHVLVFIGIYRCLKFFLSRNNILFTLAVWCPKFLLINILWSKRPIQTQGSTDHHYCKLSVNVQTLLSVVKHRHLPFNFSWGECTWLLELLSSMNKKMDD